MATENTEPKNENTQGQPAAETTDWRSQPGAIAMANQIKKLQEALDAKAAAEARAQQEAQERKLKEAGDYEALKASLEADAKAKIAAAAAEVRRAKIEALTSGIADEDAREGVAAKMERLGPDEDLSKWLTDYKAAKPHLWSSAPVPLIGGQQTSGRPVNVNTKLTASQLSMMLESKDPEERSRALEYRFKLWSETGKTNPE